MKKMFLFLLVITMFIVPTAVSAAPAPPLTNVQIIGVTSDGANYV